MNSYFNRLRRFAASRHDDAHRGLGCRYVPPALAREHTINVLQRAPHPRFAISPVWKYPVLDARMRQRKCTPTPGATKREAPKGVREGASRAVSRTPEGERQKDLDVRCLGPTARRSHHRNP